MNLYLVRHAQPEADGDDPPLSPKGVQQVAKIAALFARINPPRDRLTLLASTLQRARHTAEGLANNLNVAVAEIATFPGPDSDLDDLAGSLLVRLRALAAAGQTELIVIGHSNYLPPTAERLLGTAATAFPGGEAFAAAACLNCDGTFAPASARLRWLVLPELLS